jgi:hypothetical protein
VQGTGEQVQVACHPHAARLPDHMHPFHEMVTSRQGSDR